MRKSFCALLLVFALCLFTQCGEEDGEVSGEDWPPANVLSTYGASGLTKPGEADDVFYQSAPVAGGSALTITWAGTAASGTAIVGWFEAPGSEWGTLVAGSSWTRFILPSNYSATYQFSNSVCVLVLTKTTF